MNRDDIIKMAKEAWLRRTGCVWTEPKCWSKAELVRFAELVAAAEREKVAQWMLREGYATGPGNTIEDLLQKLDWQIREREREACAQVVADAVDHREPASTYVGKIKEHFGQGKSQDHWQPDPDLA